MTARRFDRMQLIGLVVVASLVLGACGPRLIGPASNDATYRQKAGTSAESALSAVRTSQLLVETARRQRSFGAYVPVAISEQEDALAAVRRTFESIQPPTTSLAVRDELRALLDRSVHDVSSARITIRSERRDRLGATPQDLERDASDLHNFIQEHGK